MQRSSNAAVTNGIKDLCTEESGTFAYLDAGGEQNVLEITPTTRVILHSVWLDLVNMTQDGTIKEYFKVDGSTYREFRSTSFTVASDPDGMLLSTNAGINSSYKVTYTEGADEGADRNIPYLLVYEERE